MSWSSSHNGTHFPSFWHILSEHIILFSLTRAEDYYTKFTPTHIIPHFCLGVKTPLSLPKETYQKVRSCSDDNKRHQMSSEDIRWHLITSDDTKWHQIKLDDIRWHQLKKDDNSWYKICKFWICSRVIEILEYWYIETMGIRDWEILIVYKTDRNETWNNFFSNLSNWFAPLHPCSVSSNFLYNSIIPVKYQTNRKNA